MCDYSLHHVRSRPARVGEKLVSARFSNSITRGLVAEGEPQVAVCLLPGTEVVFEREVEYDGGWMTFTPQKVTEKVARFRLVDTEKPYAHHHALEFPGGQVVLVTRLREGQRLTVLQLPVVSHSDRDILGIEEMEVGTIR